MKMRAIRTAAAMVCIWAGALAWAQDTSQGQDIIVPGTRLEEMAQDFVAQIAATSASEDQYARWDSRICPGAVGLQPDVAQRLVDRISQRAAAVGLRPGAAGCRANVMVIYAPDSDTLSRQIVDQRRDLLGYYTEEGVTTAGRAGLEEFATTPRAIRWWHVGQTTGADGQAIGGSDTQAGLNVREAVALSRAEHGGETASAAGGAGAGTGAQGSDGIGTSTGLSQAAAAMGTGSFDGLEGTRSSGSRMRRETRQDLSYVLIVVDARRVADVPPEAWMDYVSMVALAHINPNAAPAAYPTILNLFSAPDRAPDAMSDWDVAFLDGLYAATRNANNSRAQARQIAQRMSGQVSAP